MRIIINQHGVKRELVGGFEVCGDYADLQWLAECILAKVKPYDEPVSGYGWIEVAEHVDHGGGNTPPRPWAD